MRMNKIDKYDFEVIENNTVSRNSGQQPLPVMKTIKEISELSGMSYTSLRQMCLRNEIVHIRVGKKYLINYDRFVDLLDKGFPAKNIC